MDKIKRQHYEDFGAHADACEKNYWRLMRLMPGLLDGCDDSQTWSYVFGECALFALELCLIRSEKYTHTVLLACRRSEQLSDESVSKAFYSLYEHDQIIVLTVRLYQDVKTAEVVDDDTFKQLAGHYPYPNVKMYQPDEKLQRNKFIELLLSSCLKSGMMAAPYELDINPKE
ncbi:MAG: DUF1249 domain-containing protein [Pseudomonadota bacterium]